MLSSFNAISTTFQRHFNAISTSFQGYFDKIPDNSMRDIVLKDMSFTPHWAKDRSNLAQQGGDESLVPERAWGELSVQQVLPHSRCVHADSRRFNAVLTLAQELGALRVFDHLDVGGNGI